MLKMGVPKDAVRQKMLGEGLSEVQVSHFLEQPAPTSGASGSGEMEAAALTSAPTAAPPHPPPLLPFLQLRQPFLKSTTSASAK